LSELSKKKILFLQENPEYNDLYKKLVNTSIVSENEFWELFDKFKQTERENWVKNEIDMGIPNSLIKYIPLSSTNQEISLTSENMKTICRIYPEIKEKIQFSGPVLTKENIKLATIFFDKQIKESTELVGGHDDISIEEIYKEKIRKYEIPQEINKIFGHANFPDFGNENNKGIYMSISEAEINVIKEEENSQRKITQKDREEEQEEEEKLNGMIDRINRHSKRIILSVLNTSQQIKNPILPPTASHRSNAPPQIKILNTQKSDCENIKISACKLLDSLNKLKTNKNLDSYIITPKLALDLGTQIGNSAGLAYTALSEKKAPSSNKLINAEIHYRAVHMYLKVFYNLFPVFNRKRKETLDKLENHLTSCMTSIKVLFLGLF